MKKTFEKCGHSGKGKCCHRCQKKVEEKNSPEEQLSKLDSLGYTAKKERKKLLSLIEKKKTKNKKAKKRKKLKR